MSSILTLNTCFFVFLFVFPVFAIASQTVIMDRQNAFWQEPGKYSLLTNITCQTCECNDTYVNIDGDIMSGTLRTPEVELYDIPASYLTFMSPGYIRYQSTNILQFNANSFFWMKPVIFSPDNTNDLGSASGGRIKNVHLAGYLSDGTYNISVRDANETYNYVTNNTFQLVNGTLDDAEFYNGLKINTSDNYYISYHIAEHSNLSDDISDSSIGTLMAWVNLDSFNPSGDNYNMIINSMEGPHDTDNYMRFGINIDRELDVLVFRNSVDYLCDTQGSSINSDEWNHIAVRQNGSGIAMYINGYPKTIACATGNSSDPTWWDDICPANTRWSIGGMPYLTGLFGDINGSIDDVIIFERALSSSEILDIYNDGRNKATFDTSNLVAYYKFNNNGNDETGVFDMLHQDGGDFTDDKYFEMSDEPFFPEFSDGNVGYMCIDALGHVYKGIGGCS